MLNCLMSMYSKDEGLLPNMFITPIQTFHFQDFEFSYAFSPPDSYLFTVSDHNYSPKQIL